MRSRLPVVLTAFALAMTGTFIYVRSHRHHAPQILGTISDFTLTDQSGEPYGAAQLRGHVWIANFIFTRCTSICPLFTEKMATLQNTIPAAHLVSFSVDPDFDKPPILAAYATAHGANPTRWSFLTGDAEAIKHTVVDSMKIAVERRPDQPIGMSVLHGKHFVLIDRQLRIRGYYDSSDPQALQQLTTDSASL